MTEEWCIYKGEKVNNLLQWAEKEGGPLVSLTGMTIEAKISKLHDDKVLETHTLSEVSETVENITYNVAVAFVPNLAPGSYRVKIQFKQASSEPIIVEIPNPLQILP